PCSTSFGRKSSSRSSRADFLSPKRDTRTSCSKRAVSQVRSCSCSTGHRSSPERRKMNRDSHEPELRLERITELPQDFDDDWESGANRFDGPGEVLFEARVGSRLVGICGLDRDPYAQWAEIGHLFNSRVTSGSPATSPNPFAT